MLSNYLHKFVNWIKFKYGTRKIKKDPIYILEIHFVSRHITKIMNEVTNRNFLKCQEWFIYESSPYYKLIYGGGSMILTRNKIILIDVYEN